MRRDPAKASAAGPVSAPRGRGFRHAGVLVEERIRSAGEKRGFAVTRLLTRWDEIVGADTARLARPIKLSWARGARRSAGGLGATLTLVTSGAAAPMVQMLLPRIRERVNACYGYTAVARIVLSQTTAQMPAGGVAAGFSEAQAPFAPATPRTEPAVAGRAAELAAGVRDDGLRTALESLACNILSRAERSKGKTQ